MYCSSRSFYQTKRQSSDNQIAPHKSSLFAHRSGLSHKPGPFSHHRPFSSKHSLFLQPRLTIGQPNDKYEQEADWVADEVMRMPELGVQRQVEPEEEEEERLQAKPLAGQINPLVQVQRQEKPEEEEETLQAKPLAEQITPLVQRQVEPEEEEEEEPIQAKLADGALTQREEEEEKEETIQTKQVSTRAPAVTPNLASRIQSLKGGGQPLPRSMRAFFEPRFGYDFSHVRVHTDSHARNTARAINAKAFTTGNDVVFGAGQYSPETSTGKRLLAHELMHVIQQQNSSTHLRHKGTLPSLVSNKKGSIAEVPFISRRRAGRRHRSRRCVPVFHSLNAKVTGKTMVHKGRGWCELEFGIYPPGITFKSDVSLSASCKGGRLEYLQLVDGYRQVLDNAGKRRIDKTRGHELDTRDPYYRSKPVPSAGRYIFPTNDSPGHPIDKLRYIKINATFKMWILWRHRTGSRRRPLGVVKWEWGVEARRIRRSGCLRSWKILNLKEKGGRGYRTNKMPSWKRTASLPNTFIP